MLDRKNYVRGLSLNLEKRKVTALQKGELSANQMLGKERVKVLYNMD